MKAEKAESRETLERLAEEQAALLRLATLVADGVPPREIFSAVSDEVAQLFAACGLVLRFEEDGLGIVSVGVSGGIDIPVGARWEFEEGMASLEVYRTGSSARVDAFDWSSGSGPAAETAERVGIVSSVSNPILVQSRLWGAITVLSTGGRLPDETEDRLERFSRLVATAIANAESRDAVSRTRNALEGVAAEQAALRRVATLVARVAPSTEVFETVATEVGKLFDTEITVLGRYGDDGVATAIGNWSASGRGVPAGTRSAVGGRNVLTMVAETGKPARVDGYDDASGEAGEIARRYGWRSSIAAPIVVEDRLWGVMLVATERPEPFPAGAEERLAAFTDLVATAIANTESRAEVEQLAEEQAALRRVATLVAKEDRPEEVFAKVAEETGRLLGGVECTLLRNDRDGAAVNVANWGEKISAVFPLGSRFFPDGDGVAATVLRTGRPHRIDDYSTVAMTLGCSSDHVLPVGNGCSPDAAITVPVLSPS